MQIVDRLLDAPCYIIDFLPQQVPKDCGGQFFAVEDYWLKHRGRYDLRDRFVCSGVAKGPAEMYFRRNTSAS